MDGLLSTSSLQNSLECPVCFEYLAPPVYQCPNGHSICSRCHQHVPTCPECRSDMSQSYRNLTIEKILESIQVKCRFPGCDVITTLSARSAHLSSCPFNPYVECLYVGCNMIVEDLPSHLKSVHNVKEFDMSDIRGVRGWNSKSWRMADWGFSIWNFNGELILNQSQSNRDFFYLWVFDIGNTRKRVKLTVEKDGKKVSFILVTASARGRRKSMPFHLNIKEIENHFLEAAEGLEEGYQRLTIHVELLVDSTLKQA
ncbi:unnamed protein product [Blepharisma stoltei]|uniref:RING-type domain-containing protein n=1 Tax=Blepharisma stoltei TaxID=1481888 RepID=A0AAU9JKP3_9CILI|nr:unnamed protein product [Blepharisma stoltei]